MTDALKPSPSLLSKIGSIIIHLEEFESSDGHYFDRIVLQQLFNDPEVKEWLKQMNKLAMLPKKRKP